MNRFTLPKVTYSETGLLPLYSPEQMAFHYGKHHRNYIDTLNRLLENSDMKEKPLEEIVARASGPLFNNAAQAWNHTFFWNCMTPEPQKPRTDSDFFECLLEHFDSVENFKSEFSDCASRLFGSGWTWLAMNSLGELEIINAQNAANPIREEKLPLLACDVWEHAYYIDYRNKREEYLNNFFNKINWRFVEHVYKERDVSFIGEWMELDEGFRRANMDRAG